MKYTKYVIAKVDYDTEETWKETEKDINRATIVEITQGVDKFVNDGQNQ